MIFKSFTDQNGNSIPVQGAGTVYDENKNAIKHGVGLVSSGYNQVIHGRHNAPNAAMEEIVGGGYGPDTYRITVKGFDWDNNDHNFPTPPGINQDAFIQPAVLIIQKITTQMDAKFDWYIVIEVIQQAITNGDKTTKSVSYHGIVEGDIRVGDTIDITTYESAGYSSISVHRFDYIDGILYHKDGTKLPNNYIDINHNDDFIIEGFCDCGNYILSKEEVTASNDNIRTLDWLGNETIKGTLTAGKDVVCKDFLGNPVSLLNLHDDFGRLTGTILVELDTSGGSIDAYHEGDSFEAIFADTLLNKTFKVRVRLHNLDVDEYIIVDAYRYNDGNKKVVDIYCGNRIIRIVTNQDNSIDIDPIELDNIFSANS